MSESLKCPECGGSSVSHEVGNLTMEVCSACGGIWFGANELKQVMAQGVTALDELMGFEPVESHAVRPQSTLTCPQCRIVLHRNQLAHSADVKVDTCYGCGGLYLSAAALVKLDQSAHVPPAGQPHATTPEGAKLAHAVDVMIQDDQWRTNTLQNYLNVRDGCRANPYFRIAGI